MSATIARRRGSSSGTSPAPTRSKLQRFSSTSGAPLVTTLMRPSRSASVSMLLISLRSEVNGTSPTRRNRCRRMGVSPALRSATRNAASLGSPWTIQLPPSSRREASPARAPPASTARISSRIGPSASGRPSTRSSPSGR